MRWMIVGVGLALLAGCATRLPLDCDWRLVPINFPTPGEQNASHRHEMPAAREAEKGR